MDNHLDVFIGGICVWLSLPDKMRIPQTEGEHMETVCQHIGLAPVPEQWSVCYPNGALATRDWSDANLD